MMSKELIANYDDPILITGANGFIGSKVVETLLSYGFKNLRCFVRPSSNLNSLNKILSAYKEKTKIEIIKGNLLSRDDCTKATQGINLIFHLAAGMEKSFPGCVMNSVVTTRNLLDSIVPNKHFKRFVNVSSIAVYSGLKIKRGGVIDEACAIEDKSYLRYEAYTYGKIKQDELVTEYHEKYHIPYVIVRPGDVYGPGRKKLSGKVGIDTFGIFLHLGGSNRIPLTYVDNCAEAIVLAGLVKGIEGNIFNIVDDDLPTSRAFLKMYKKNIGKFKSIYVPYNIFYFLCYLWEKYSTWSEGQLPPAFNRMRCEGGWKNVKYTNSKLKKLLGWQPKVSFQEASKRYFEYQKSAE